MMAYHLNTSSVNCELWTAELKNVVINLFSRRNYGYCLCSIIKWHFKNLNMIIIDAKRCISKIIILLIAFVKNSIYYCEYYYSNLEH